MNLKDAAAREAVLRALHDAIGEELKSTRAEVQAGMDEAQETTGVRQIAAILPDGTVVATISLSDPKPAAVITDDAAFLSWVRETYPSEVARRFITEVQPAFTNRVLSECTAAGVAEVCDRETGEVHNVPGVEIRATRARTHSVRFGKTGRDAIAAAWQAGQLTNLALPQLTAGDPQ